MTQQFWLDPYFNGNMFDVNRWKLEIFWPVRFDCQTVFIKSSGHQSMCLLVYMSNLTDLTNPLFDLRSHTMNEGLPAGCLATLPAAVTGATSLPILHPAHIANGSAGLVGSSCA